MAGLARLPALGIDVLEDLGDGLAGICDLLEEQLEQEDLFERGLKLNQADLNVDHAQVFLTVELLANHKVSRVQQHHSLVLLGYLDQRGVFGVREDGEVAYFRVELPVGLVAIVL